MDFFKYKNQLKPEKGRLLISEPFLPDPNFERTVVLLCEYNDDGAFGFVINKPSILKLNEIVEDLRFEELAFVGGPVQQDTLHFLHRNAALENAVQIRDRIYWGGDFELAIDLLKKGHIDASRIRFYIGYSGWSEGQLNEEMNQKSWLTLEATRKLVFHRNIDEIWKDAVKSLGGDYSIMVNFPTDPQLN